MSFGNSYNGGRTRMKTKIFLNLYDLSPANDYLYQVGLGFHHSGIEINGTEYTFATGGIFETPPKQAPGARFRGQIELGSYDGGMQELNQALDELRHGDFGPNNYNLIQRNCNHFANALSWKLLRQRIPPYVNRLADIGNCCSCLLPKAMLEDAPVGGSGGGSGQQSGSTRSFAVPTNATMQRAGASSSNAPRQPTFSGKGHTLGAPSSSSPSGSSATSSSNNSSSIFSKLASVASTTISAATASSSAGNQASSSSSSSQENLMDRREKARKAALARLEKNSNKQS